MDDDVYFDGDPAVDSRRRHLERVLKGAPRRRWPWVAAIVAGGGAWAIWRLMRPRDAQPADTPAAGSPGQETDGADSGRARPRRDG
jgi:hypothetical protein